VLPDTAANIFTNANVEFIFGILHNVKAGQAILVAGAGFEPAVPQSRDYQPS
jgi:hypothetical protein